MNAIDTFVFARATGHRGRTATIADGKAHTYDDLAAAAQRIAGHLLDGDPDLDEARVAFLIAPGFEWVAAQWGIWQAGGIAVPFAASHPPRELEHVIDDAEPSIIIAGETFAERLRPLAESRGIPFVDVTSWLGDPPAGAHAATPADLLRPDRRAMMLYTSGTTGRPKGVVTTHANVGAQIRTLVSAWGWTGSDRILHVLPLHHVHGIINVLSCALWSGACCEFLPGFDPGRVWNRLASGEITTFMAVPTIYHRLISEWESATTTERDAWSRGARTLRLMVSGSAALPVRTLERWREITGHTLLERYGMTEIGMALSNPLDGERRAGTVGRPLPGVHARIVDDDGTRLDEGRPGQIEVRGPQVFEEYWRRPAETTAAFRDGWFMTGDEAVVENGCWRILGRRSTDIIKTAGYKISALEIEDALREHEAVQDCAVIGVPDDDLGERVVAAVVGSAIDGASLAAWARERMAPYKVPREFRVVDALPRNAMGKVTKPAVRELFGRSV